MTHRFYSHSIIHSKFCCCWIKCTPNNAFISIYAYILHPSGCYSIASQWNMKIPKEIGLLIGVDRVHCLDFIDELMGKMNRRKKGFFVLFKGADIERLSIHWVSQSYYYFAIILTLIPFREPVSQPQHRRFTIHEVTLWWIWTIQTGRTRIQKKKNASHHIVKNLIIYDFGRSKMFRLSLPDPSHRSLCTDDILKTMGTTIFFPKTQGK